MDIRHPVYTTEAQCQDCYKCVRECPVKAIRIEKHHASILPEFCISCGRCVEVCPAQAKNIRDDIGRARLLLQSGAPVVASLAPSWVCEFPDVKPEKMIAALEQMGFIGVSETAVGAEAVSAEISRQIGSAERGLFISSACPAVVEWIRKYQPHLAGSITRVVSPLLAHCRLLRQTLTDDLKIVFFGPCIAKKVEADQHASLLNIALTFKDLHKMLSQASISLSSVKTYGSGWLIEPSRKGRLYPAEGGMLRTLHDTGRAELISVSGFRNIQADIEGIQDISQNRPVFLEALACSGGCINGPAMSCSKESGLLRKLTVFSQEMPSETVREASGVDLRLDYPRAFVTAQSFGDYDVAAALRRVDKHHSGDELNCSGCGYETCREFAAAMLQGKAEPEMCVSYMRKKAQKKANALLRCIPSGVVIVDRDLRIIECNRPFAEMFDDDTKATFDSLESLEKAHLSKIVPFADLFRLTLHTGKDISRENYLAGKHILNLSIFSIQPGQIAGAVIQDVTQVQWRRQEIARNAREVLRRNLAIVQEIAHKLGEHMADNEVLLNSIAYSYSDETEAERDHEQP